MKFCRVIKGLLGNSKDRKNTNFYQETNEINLLFNIKYDILSINSENDFYLSLILSLTKNFSSLFSIGNFIVFKSRL